MNASTALESRGTAGNARRLALTVCCLVSLASCSNEVSPARPLERRATAVRPSVENKTILPGQSDAPSTVLPTCDGTGTANGAPKVWRLTARQWANALRSLGGTQVDEAGFPPDSKAGRFDTDPNGLIPRTIHHDFFDAQADRNASQVLTSLRARVSCTVASAEALANAACRDTFVRSAMEAVYRRPPADDEVAAKAQLFENLLKLGTTQEAAVDFTAALLRSPHFLYRVNASARLEAASAVERSYAVANHLSFSLADLPPDAEAVGKAKVGALATQAQLRDEALRLLRTKDGEAKFLSFARQWLKLAPGGGREPERDATKYPEYSKALYQQMLRETEEYLRADILGKAATVQAVFEHGHGYVTPALEAYYKRQAGSAPGTEPMRKDLAEDGRHGILTHGSVLVSMSGRDKTHVNHRANILRSHFACHSLPGPPADAFSQNMNKEPAVGPQTEKMKHEAFLKTARGDCVACHRSFVPYGLALENYDADGRFRTEDKGLRIDASGQFIAPSGSTVAFTDAKDFLSNFSGWDAVAHCTLIHAHEFHWGAGSGAGHACALRDRGRPLNARTAFAEIYLAPVTQTDFFESW